MKIKYFIEDLTNEHIDYCDNYIKKVISNAKITFYREKSKIKKYDIVFLSLENCENEILCHDDNTNIFTTYITVNDTPIPVHNSDLAEVLLELTETKRIIVLRNIVLDHTLKDIAKDLNISF